MESLIVKGADINERDRAKKSALWWAADSRQTDAVRVLLDKGADPNLADFDGTTPLGVAALNGNEPVVLLLLAHHANVNAVDTTGVRPLDNAVRLGFADVAETLRSAGAKCGDNEAYSKACKGTVRANWLEPGRGSEYRSRLSRPSPFRYFKTSSEIIRLAVMMYVWFSLPLRNVD